MASSDPDSQMTSEMRDNISSFEQKYGRLKELKKGIKDAPDDRAVEARELQKECKEIKQMIADELLDEQIVLINRRKFKKRRLVKVRYSKENVHTYISGKTDCSPDDYDRENAEETVILGAVKKGE
jgi:hypothetical protein